MANRWRNHGNSDRLYLGGGAPKSLQIVNAVTKIKMVGPWRKNYDKESILKSRDIPLLANVSVVKAMIFPVVTYGCESWTINKSKHWRIDAFEPRWCWRRLLRIPWTARKSNQSILKEISPEGSLEGLTRSWNSNSLATWCKERTHWKRLWCWKNWRKEKQGTTEDEMDGSLHQIDWHDFEQALRVGDGQGSLACCNPWGRRESEMTAWLNCKFQFFIERSVYFFIFQNTDLDEIQCSTSSI